MKTINDFIAEHLKYSIFSINEKLKISSKSNMYTCHPKDKYELRKILEERLAEDKNANLNDIDVSQIKDMGFKGFRTRNGLFEGLDPHNIDISEWDVSNVTVMSCMFNECKNFTGEGLENWNVFKVEDMSGMFNVCQNFDCDLGNWDVSNVKNMFSMFNECENFTGKGLENWNVSNVENMSYLFGYCENFDCDLNKWDVSNVIHKISTFAYCTSLKKYPDWYD